MNDDQSQQRSRTRWHTPKGGDELPLRARDRAGTRGRRRWTARRVLAGMAALLALFFVVMGGFVVRSGYRRCVCEREATARLRALNANFMTAAVGPPWLVRWLVRFNLPVLRSIGSINGVGPAFGDSDLALLRYSTQIGNLDLDRTQVTDAGLAYLRDFAKLTILELDETQVTDAGLAHLKALPRLRVVTLAGTSITDAGLAHLAEVDSLSWVDIQNTSVTDEGLAHLAGLANLTRVDLEGTRVTQEGIAGLKRALPDIEIHGP